MSVFALTTAGETLFDDLLARNAARRVHASLGAGTFEYEGAQAIDLETISVWRIVIYGGIAFADSGVNGAVSRRFGALAGPALARQ